MEEKRRHTTCYHCTKPLEFDYHHSGFGDEIFFYCAKCGMVAVIHTYSRQMSEGKFYEKHNLMKQYNGQNEKSVLAFENNFKKMKVDISSRLNKCFCGGQFTAEAIPRCPHCGKELEWDKIIDEIDKNSGRGGQPRFRECLKKGWHDVYYFVFNGKQVNNNWKT